METKFNNDEYNFVYPNGIENNFWNLARNKIILNIIKKHPIGNVLDIGCGRGIVSDYLFKNKISIQGVELGNSTPISNSKIPILYNTNALSISKESAVQYNTICLFDVIEHIEDPKSFITDLISHFQNVEYLIITVPSRNELWSNFDDFYGHFRRYDLSFIEDEIKKNDFSIVEKRYFFQSLYLLIRINNKLTKKRIIQFKAPNGLIKLIHKVLAHIFYIEHFIVPGKFYGSSIICIAKKIKK